MYARPNLEFVELLGYVFCLCDSLNSRMFVYAVIQTDIRVIDRYSCHELLLRTSSTCSFVQSNLHGQDIAVRTVTMHLVRRSSVRMQAGAKEYFFFTNISSPALKTTKSVQCLLRNFSGGIEFGALCLPLGSMVEGKNKQIYTSVLPIGMDDLDRDNWVKCSYSRFWVIQRSSH